MDDIAFLARLLRDTHPLFHCHYLHCSPLTEGFLLGFVHYTHLHTLLHICHICCSLHLHTDFRPGSYHHFYLRNHHIDHLRSSRLLHICYLLHTALYHHRSYHTFLHPAHLGTLHSVYPLRGRHQGRKKKRRRKARSSLLPRPFLPSHLVPEAEHQYQQQQSCSLLGARTGRPSVVLRIQPSPFALLRPSPLFSHRHCPSFCVVPPFHCTLPLPSLAVSAALLA
mmetsp:Transcript_28912/g.74208  ORF Transcript_28912/g.74208 Transcript_28912/m.74208 type:complete len:224 (-) Transcript_28912:2480-3151(-)